MEIYRNQNGRVVIDVPDPLTSYKATVRSANYETEEIPPTIVDEAGTAHIIVDIGFRHAAYDGIVSIEVSMDDGEGEYSWVEHVSVVTPLFTWRDLPDTYNKEDSEELEGLVRKVVEAYTGQSFGPSIREYTTEFGENMLRFDAPLIELRGASTRYLTHTTTLAPPKIRYESLDGGFKAVVDIDLYDPKTDSMWILNQKKNYSMTIEGVFGYDRVPQDVKQAALLIAGTWSDDQAVWRDRFIETMRSADWTVSYHENAFSSTGSATADMLLKKYHRRAVPEVL